MNLIHRILPFLHAHPIELIVLSHDPIFKEEEKLNQSIWKMCPEVRVNVPKGIHCTPYSITQSAELAKSTIAGLSYRDVALWEEHGTKTIAPDIMQVWDYLDVANKGPKLLLNALEVGFETEGFQIRR